MSEHQIELLKKAVADLAPGLIVIFAGIMLILGVGVWWLVDAAPAIRSLIAGLGLSSGKASALYFFALAIPLGILCWCGKRILGYSLFYVNRHTRARNDG
jgi:hypothetical protein